MIIKSDGYDYDKFEKTLWVTTCKKKEKKKKKKKEIKIVPKMNYWIMRIGNKNGKVIEIGTRMNMII